MKLSLTKRLKALAKAAKRASLQGLPASLQALICSWLPVRDHSVFAELCKTLATAAALHTSWPPIVFFLDVSALDRARLLRRMAGVKAVSIAAARAVGLTIGASDIEALPASLERLELRRCCLLSQALRAMRARGWDALRELSVSHVEVTHEALLEALIAARPPKLQSLDLAYLEDNVSNAALAGIAKLCPTLTKLCLAPGLRRKTKFTEAAFVQHLSPLPLTVLEIDAPNLTDAALIAMAKAKMPLTKLSLTSSELTAAGCEALASLPLRWLHLPLCREVTDDCVRALAACATLQDLHLVAHTELRSLAPVAALPALTSLSCSSLPCVRDDAVRLLEATAPRLNRLRLQNCVLSDAAVRALRPLTALTELSLAGCPQIALKDSEAVGALCGLSRLTALDLGYCSISAQSPLLANQRLRELPALRRVRIALDQQQQAEDAPPGQAHAAGALRACGFHPSGRDSLYLRH